ncbi:hypothetical protein IW150_003086 [Coemansia sp. RSA 2607]|nr:hypothetical protein IW150_003086 [Coemansia sp. RSA 2607]KAJ2383492.1 hypothetical protein GGI05_005298 [Coemansia sp. RSA 2603]
MSTRQCTVCNESAAKYKCPKCRIGYCSVKCFKIHKTEPCMAADSENITTTQKPVAPAQNTLAANANATNIDEDDEEEAKYRLKPEDLQKLDSSEEVRELLLNPELRSLMEAVCKDPNPVEAIRILRQRSDFETLVQAFISATDSNN